MTSALLKQQVEKSYPTVVRGKGVWLWDSDGRDYIDGSSGAMTANIGHGVSEIADAMQQQAKSIAFTFRTQFTNKPAEDLASRLAALAPGDLDYVFFVSSGSEASEYAMRVALHVWKEKGQPGKVRFLSRERSYHGMTMGALSMSGHDARRPDYGPLLHDFPSVAAAYSYRSAWSQEPEDQQYKSADDWEKAILHAGPDHVAAVIVEPIVGAAGGALVAPPGYFRRLREICDRHDVLLIMDEVITGMGRTGVWFASEQEGIVPDMIITAKGLSAGYAPMGAVLMRTHLIDAMRKGSGYAPFGHTFSGNPLSSAVCMAVLDYLEKHHVLDNVRARGEQLEQGLKALSSRYPHMVDVRGRGLLWGFEFVLDRQTRTPPPAAFNATGVFSDICQSEGLIVYPAGIKPYNNAALVAPPLVISDQEIQELLRRLDVSLTQMQDRLEQLVPAL